MKRLWAASALLLALLAGCLVNAWYVHDFMDRTADQLELAQEKAQAGNWEAALELTRQAQKAWTRRNFYLRVVLSHRDVDLITRGMAQAEEDLIHRSMDQYAPTNRDTAAQLRILGNMELPSLVNVL